jgi:hypothetical protein
MNRFQIKVITDAMDQPENLTDWECDFIDDLAEKGEDYELSDKQNAIINRIGQKLS